MKLLKVSTASQEVVLGPFVDSTDGVTAETGLTIANTDIRVWKSGGTTFANKNSGGGTHMEDGFYYCTLDATDTNTTGILELNITMAGALPVRETFLVLAAASYDAIVGDTGSGLVADVWTWRGGSVPAPANAGQPTVDLPVPSAPTGVPALGTDTAEDLLAWISAILGLHKVTQTSSTTTVRNAADSANIATGGVSDDGTTFTRGEFS